MTVDQLKRVILDMIDSRISQIHGGYYIDINNPKSKDGRYESLKEARLRVATNANISGESSRILADIVNELTHD